MKSPDTCKTINSGTTHGFTYLEVLVVLALLGGILSMGLVLQSDVVLRNEVRSERDVFVSALLMTARSRALGNLYGEAHGIHINPTEHEYTLFQGDTYDASDETNQVIPFQNETVSIQNENGSNTIVFEPLTAHVREGGGTYTLTLTNHTLSVHVNDVGQIDW